MRASTLFVALVLAVLLSCYVADAAQRARELHRRRRATPTTADVFMGYMDEESYYTLSTLLAKQKSSKTYSQVLLIERCKRGTDASKYSHLLQRPITDDAVFPGAATLHMWAAGNDGTLSLDRTPKTAAASDLATALATALTNGVNKNNALVTQLDNVWAPWIKTKTDKTKPSVCLFQWGYESSKATDKAAIVIRTPEMGLNPSAVRPYVLSELAAIKTAGITTMDLWAVGASGAANSKDCAGCMQTLSASWFAGFEVEAKKAYPEIAYDSIDDAAPVILTNDDKSISIDVPNGKPPKNDLDTIKTNSKDKWEALATDDTNATKLKRAAKVHVDARAVGMTLSYFGGEKTKSASSAMFGHSTNTEDYHVIRIMEDVANNKCNAASTVAAGSCPTMSNKRVFRVDCDPYSVSKAEVDLLNSGFLHNKDHAFTTIEKHAAVILWGLQGMKLGDITSNNHVMCWQYAKEQITAGKIKLTQFIPVFKNSDTDFCVLNPAFLETATDFYADSLEADPKAKWWGTYRDAGQTEVRKLSAASTASEVEKVLIDHVAKALWTNFFDITKQLADANVDYAKSDYKPTGSPSKKEDVAGTTFTKTSPIPIWSRNGWDVYHDKTALNGNEIGCIGLWNLNSEGTDRMYYKASNFPGLRDLNKKLVTGSISAFAKEGALDDTCTCGNTRTTQDDFNIKPKAKAKAF